MQNLIVKQEKRLGSNSRIQILGTSIDVLDSKDTISLVEQYVITKTPLHLMGVNADKINAANDNKLLREIINGCGIINADGASVILASKFLKKPLPERVAGIDLMQDLVALSAKKNYSIFLLGAKKNIVEDTAKVLKTKYDKLNIVGIHDGYFKENDWDSIADLLSSKNPDFVFVGITSPIKEYLIEYLQNKGLNSVFMGVGGSFDVISGKIPRAPKWMQKANLEWLFRVSCEPKRLFKRYFIGNTKFIKNVIEEKSN
ncbi:WecB/TagA/CpsF family glycosyltransferase [Limosilactobacillus albertensis]|uniref:WecB/TagA/CpsF family glycosyltransferase n=1 Tax=Limosilactobacillus albertensis TaxID=2759752 RepID=A0A839H1T2_9LACO|nr:WecB/TagA/CpsF family glycosyltransferase [Limosilactobacillus albertensis]MBB1124545.1 WecB/TagA/CpsF family glycosyltransferase [Limosilactobacillus albertensis]MCD7123079.1 WecB/TagA/CpsF family glycosyltransferase [Limosilactobacillus albertensis]